MKTQGGFLMVKRALLAIVFATLSATLWAAGEQIPAGTVLNCRLSQPLSTSLNSTGQSFTAMVTEPVFVNGAQVIPYGATIQGRISALVHPGRIRGAGEMVLTPQTVSFQDGRTIPVSAVLTTAYGAPGVKVADTEGTLKGPSGRTSDMKEVGIGMGGGGLLGTLIGGAHGAVLGLAIGGAAGFIDRIRRGGPDLSLPTGTELKFQLTHELALVGSGSGKVEEYSLNRNH
jgi:hypothetical protein